MSHPKLAAVARVAAASTSSPFLKRLLTSLLLILFAYLPARADHIHYLHYNNSVWLDQDLTTTTGGGIATSFGAIAAFNTTPNNQLHVFYVDNNAQHLRQLYYNGTSWTDEDLTSITGGPIASPYGLSGFALGNLQQVFYIGNDSHVHETVYNNINWSDQDLTAAAGASSAGFGPVLAFATKPNNQFHVYYQGPNLDLHQLYFNGTSWSDSDLTSITGAYCYGSWISGFAAGNLQEIFCPGFGKITPNLDMLHIYYNNVTWVYEDVTFRAGGSETPMYLGGGVAAFKVPGAVQAEVYGVTNNAHINQYTFVTKPNQWIDQDLSSNIGAPTDGQFGGIVAFATSPPVQYHIYYAPSTEVYQIYYNGTAWAINDLTNGVGQADPNSGMAGFTIGNFQQVFYMSTGN